LDLFFALWIASALAMLWSLYQPLWLKRLFLESMTHFFWALGIVFLATVIFIDIPTWFGFSWSFMP